MYSIYYPELLIVNRWTPILPLKYIRCLGWGQLSSRLECPNMYSREGYVGVGIAVYQKCLSQNRVKMIREMLPLEVSRHFLNWPPSTDPLIQDKTNEDGVGSLFKAIELIYRKSFKSINKCRLYPVLVSLSLGRLQNKSISLEASLRSTTQGCLEPEKWNCFQ